MSEPAYRDDLALVHDRGFGLHAERVAPGILALPRPDLFVRELTTFVRTADGSYRRDDERHENVLVDAAAVPPLLARYGVCAAVGASFGAETLPPGLVTVIGHRAVVDGAGPAVDGAAPI